MSDGTTNQRRLSKGEVAASVFWGSITAGWASFAVAEWVYDGPDWFKVLLWALLLSVALALDLLVEDDPPRNTYRRRLAERGLGPRSSDD